MGEDNVAILSDGMRVGFAEYRDPSVNALFYLHDCRGVKIATIDIDILRKS